MILDIFQRFATYRNNKNKVHTYLISYSRKIFWSFCQTETKIMESFERRKLWLQWGQNQDANTFSRAQRAAACFEILVISSETRTKRPSQPPSFSWLVKQHECFTYLFLWLKPKSLYISRVVIYFYETEFEIWAGLGPARYCSCSNTFLNESSLD